MLLGMEMDIALLYLSSERESFQNSHFIHMDEYEMCYDEFLFYYAGLEAILDDESFDTLDRMMKAQEEMEEIRSRHYFRQGVLQGRKGFKKEENP